MKITSFRIALIALILPIVIVGCGCNRKSESNSGRPAPKLTVAEPLKTLGESLFEDRAEASGVSFKLGHSGKSPLNLKETMGTGCAIADFDGDGKPDIFLVGQLGTASEGRCKLFLNQGNGVFKDATLGSGLEQPGMYMGCAVGDLDNDGLPDLLVTGYGTLKLYHNLGKGKFQDVTKSSGIDAPKPDDWFTSAGFAEVTHSGKLDLYIGRYVLFNSSSLEFCNYGKIKSACGPNFYDAQQGVFYRNLGGFKFKNATHEFGLDVAHGKCLGVVFGDVNNDGWPDLYLGNDEMPGDLFINQGGKGFKNVALESGVALSGDGQVQGAMGVDFGDYSRTGKPDLAVATYEFEPLSLYSNSESGLFSPASVTMGVDQATRIKVGFGLKLADFDNDGYLDMAVANGHIHDNQEKIDRQTTYAQPNQLFLQEQKRFVDRSKEAGPGFTTPNVGRGLAVGDLDGDGKIDIVITDLEGKARVLFNRMKATGNWITVKLHGKKTNRLGIGSKVTVKSGSEKWTVECTTGGSYLSAVDSRVHIGIGKLEKIDSIEVLWTSGGKTNVASPKINREIEVIETP